MASPSKWLSNNKDVGILLLRLFIGLRLVYGVMDNIVSWDHMKAFEGFLASSGFPFPLVSAVVSVYCQFVAGLMIIVGYRIRIASLLMVFNFIVAILMVHRNDTVEGMTPALAMLFGCITFLFYGGGKNSIRRD